MAWTAVLRTTRPVATPHITSSVVWCAETQDARPVVVNACVEIKLKRPMRLPLDLHTGKNVDTNFGEGGLARVAVELREQRRFWRAVDEHVSLLRRAHDRVRFVYFWVTCAG